MDSLTIAFRAVIAASVLSLSSLAQQPAPPVPPDSPTANNSVADPQVTDSTESMFPHFKDTRFWLTGQANFIFQTHPEFPALYSGTHSLGPHYEKATSRVLTLYTGFRASNSMEFLVGQTMTLARTIKSHGEDQDEQAAVGEPNSTAHKLSNPRAETELIVFLTPELMHSPIAPRALLGVPDDATDDESSKMIEPAVFEPVDWDAFGPPMPVMKRRTPRE